MKKIALSLLFSLCLSINLFAQLKSKKAVDNSRQILQEVILDTSNKKIFEKYPELKSISVVYKESQPYFAFFNYENRGKAYDRREHYDLAFEGDVHILEKKYGSVQLIPSKNRITSINNRKDTRIRLILLDASIYKDTIIYRFSKGKPESAESFNVDWTVGTPAKYKGDLGLIETKLTQELARTKHDLINDSIVVFQARVNKKGNLYDMQLSVGNQSVFSSMIKKAFITPRDEFDLLPATEDWYPSVIDRGPIETTVRIYARLNPDGSITIKTPHKLRSFTGE